MTTENQSAVEKLEPCRLCRAEPEILPQFAISGEVMRGAGYAIVFRGKREVFRTRDETIADWVSDQEFAPLAPEQQSTPQSMTVESKKE